MTYTVAPSGNQREPWGIHIAGGCIGTFKKRDQAVTEAKRLAGWRGNVVVSKH